jgi:hypothetical protein
MRGRARMLQDNGVDIIEARVVGKATMEQLTALILATTPDDASQARSWGAVEFTVLSPNSARALILGKANAIALLESLAASTKDDALRSDLKDFLEYERSLVTDP